LLGEADHAKLPEDFEILGRVSADAVIVKASEEAVASLDDTTLIVYQILGDHGFAEVLAEQVQPV
jgi:hypothetical protein